MTLLGKIFTMLIFFMSVCFMAFTIAVYATHRNWRDVVMNPDATPNKPLGMKFQLENAENRQRDLQREIAELENKLAMERAARRQALAALESHRGQLRGALLAREQENTGLVQTQRVAISAMETTQNNLTRLADEVATLRGEIRVTQLDRDKHFERVVATTDLWNQAQGIKRRLEERQGQLVGQNARMRDVLDKHGLNETTPVDSIPPLVNGFVLAVSKNNLVEISIGSDDGLRQGHQLIVSRGSSYLGNIVVRKTAPDRAVGQIIKKVQRGVIQKGDRVATKA